MPEWHCVNVWKILQVLSINFLHLQGLNSIHDVSIILSKKVMTNCFSSSIFVQKKSAFCMQKWATLYIFFKPLQERRLHFGAMECTQIYITKGRERRRLPICDFVSKVLKYCVGVSPHEKIPNLLPQGEFCGRNEAKSWRPCLIELNSPFWFSFFIFNQMENIFSFFPWFWWQKFLSTIFDQSFLFLTKTDFEKKKRNLENSFP